MHAIMILLAAYLAVSCAPVFAADLVPLKTMWISDNIKDETPCEYPGFGSIKIQQCIIFEVPLPGDKVDVKQFKFDTPTKIQYQAKNIAFIVKAIAVTNQETHLHLASDPRVPVKWLGKVNANVYVTPTQPKDIVYFSLDGGSSWYGRITNSVN